MAQESEHMQNVQDNSDAGCLALVLRNTVTGVCEGERHVSLPTGDLPTR